MGILNNSILLEKEPTRKKSIECEKCKKGLMLPLNPQREINHCFVCDNCGETLVFEPQVEIE